MVTTDLISAAAAAAQLTAAGLVLRPYHMSRLDALLAPVVLERSRVYDRARVERLAAALTTYAAEVAAGQAEWLSPLEADQVAGLRRRLWPVDAAAAVRTMTVCRGQSLYYRADVEALAARLRADPPRHTMTATEVAAALRLARPSIALLEGELQPRRSSTGRLQYDPAIVAAVAERRRAAGLGRRARSRRPRPVASPTPASPPAASLAA